MAPSLAPGTLNPAILNVQYAVRGELAIKAEEYRDKLKAHPNDHGLPFTKITTANIGNPQQPGLDQKPLTFGRQVRFSVSIVPRSPGARSLNSERRFINCQGRRITRVSSADGVGQGFVPN